MTPVSSRKILGVWLGRLYLARRKVVAGPARGVATKHFKRTKVN